MTETVTIGSILFYIFVYLDVELGPADLRLPAGGLRRHPVAAEPHLPGFPRGPHPALPASAPTCRKPCRAWRWSSCFNCEPRSARRFNRGTDEYLDARLVRTLYHSAYFPFMELCGAALIALVLW